jgi:Aminoglycoside adenylyltransferase, C-terminal domain
LIDPVQPDDLRRAVLGILHEWWAPMLHAERPARLQSSEYQAYAILTMCRALYTLHYGTIVSKPVAAKWAQETLGERWAALIERALAWRHDAPLDELNETLDFIRYALERGQQLELLLNFEEG